MSLPLPLGMSRGTGELRGLSMGDSGREAGDYLCGSSTTGAEQGLAAERVVGAMCILIYSLKSRSHNLLCHEVFSVLE
jgi:hypothetical protein